MRGIFFECFWVGSLGFFLRFSAWLRAVWFGVLQIGFSVSIGCLGGLVLVGFGFVFLYCLIYRVLYFLPALRAVLWFLAGCGFAVCRCVCLIGSVLSVV